MAKRKVGDEPEIAPGIQILATVASALIGGIACVVIVATAASFGGAVRRAPLVLAWVTLLAAEGALAWAGLIPAVAVTVRSWRRIDPRTRKLIAATLVAIGGVVALSFATEPRAFPLYVEWPLGADNSRRVVLLSVIILVPAFAAVVAMWLTAALADTTRTAGTGEVAAYLDLRERLQGLLWFVGTVIGGAVLTTGTLRRTMLDGGYATTASYPAALVLAYGAFFTLLLVVSYVPAYLVMRRVGRRLRDRLLTEGGELMAWADERKKLTELLALDVGLDASLKNTVAILAPIVASFVSVALPGS